MLRALYPCHSSGPPSEAIIITLAHRVQQPSQSPESYMGRSQEGSAGPEPVAPPGRRAEVTGTQLPIPGATCTSGWGKARQGCLCGHAWERLGFVGRDGGEVGLGIVAMRRKGEEMVCGERSRKQGNMGFVCHDLRG